MQIADIQVGLSYYGKSADLTLVQGSIQELRE